MTESASNLAAKPEAELELREAIRKAMRFVHGSVGWDVRSQHPKGHAVLNARFQTLADIPAPLQVGLFSSALEYSAQVRLSNGATVDDRLRDVHGMAIKVQATDAAGTPAVQDFVLADSQTFFARDAADFLRFLQLKGRQTRRMTYALLDFQDPTVARPVENPDQVAKEVRGQQLAELMDPKNFPALARFTSNPAHSLLESTWFSQTPYQLGQQVVQFSVRPSPDNASSTPLDGSEHQFRSALAEFFAAGRTAKFTLGAILAGSDGAATPIEDATVAWNGEFIPLAEITVPPQDVLGAESRLADRRLEFAPWNTLPGITPIGSLNKARQLAYEDSARTRHANAQTIRRFYGCFAAGDHRGMKECLSADVEFKDIGFHLVGREAVGTMWQMLCLKPDGIRLSVRNVQADDQEGSAFWECQYDFQATPDSTPRPIHNRIHAKFRFNAEGKICWHEDECESFWSWFEQAMGLKGSLMHFIDYVEDTVGPIIDIESRVRRKVRESAMGKLKAFLEG